MHSRITLVLTTSTALSGLPGPTSLFFPRALSPLTPVSSAIAFIRCFIADSRLPLYSADWPLPFCVNEAESGSLALRLACSLREASQFRLL